jgi:hypothetical protein
MRTCYDVLHDVIEERKRQENLKAAGKFKYSCADSELSNAECYAVLGEELGEVGHEVNEEFNGKGLRTAEIRKELIQVAAVAVAWVERLDAESHADALPEMKTYGSVGMTDTCLGCNPHPMQTEIPLHTCGRIWR